MAANVLLRDVPSKKYAQVGAAGNRFFSSEGAVPIAHGAVVCKGFMQYVLRSSRSHKISTDIRSFRYSSCGLPVLNLDVGYSAFLASGPAVDVIAKIIGMPAARGRGGYMGGIQPKRELTEMNERDIARAKSKLRGAKVRQLGVV
jgi:eukaryotic translation initiation factor 2C